MWIRRMIFLYLFSVATIGIPQQNSVISGFVKDSVTHEALFMAHFYNHESGIGGYTNEEGSFSMKVPIHDRQLKFSFSAYDYHTKSIEVTVKSDTLLTIKLVSETQMLDEV